MSGPAPYILFPERCDQCGRCVRACPSGGLKVGAAYIAIDRTVCSGCSECVDACDRDAIVPRAMPVVAARPATRAAPATQVEVGSRAEAKALRKAIKAAPRPPAGPRTDGVVAWTLADMAAVLAIIAVATLAKSAILGLPAVGLMPAAAKAAVRAFVLAAYYAGQLAGFAFLARRHASGLREAFGLQRAENAAETPSALGSAGWVLLLFLGTETVSIGYGLAMQTMGWEQPARLSSDVSSVFGSGGVGLVLSALLVAVAAPLVEELAFRGVVLPALRPGIGVRGAIAVSSVLYAAFHLSVWMFFPTLVLGVALGWLAYSRRSILPAIALHVLYNAAAVTAAFLAVR